MLRLQWKLLKANSIKLIGIDIVDLKQASTESNWQRKGFLNKLFTPPEQLLIVNYSRPEHMVWLLWTMKEAAYKIYSREFNIRSFAPSKLLCSIDQMNLKSSKGKVTVSTTLIYTESSLQSEYICTRAAKTIDQLDQIKINLSKHPAKTMYEDNIPASISHHGDFLALAFL
jgi:phosphopantetheinyl transferase (holo-ACP synthase)